MFVMVMFAARFAGEFSHGTLRTQLMKEPRPLLVVVGKMVALLTFMAAVLMAAEILTFLASALLAPGQGVDTSAWYGVDGLGDALGDYAAALAAVSAWALLGMTVAVLIRSVAIAVGVGVAWAGPVEHIAQQSWEAASRWLPGLQLEALAAGGIVDVST
jgi:ABC-2 type transport system permease protein